MANHPAAGAGQLASVLARYDVHEPEAGGARVAALEAWAERLRGVFAAGTVAERAERADALLIDADCRPRLVRHGEGMPFHLHYAPVRAGLTARVMALTAGGLAHVIDGGGGSRLRTCQRGGCGTAFLDTSRNGRRRFCSLRCANQVNVTNHRNRRRAAAARESDHDARAIPTTPAGPHAR